MRPDELQQLYAYNAWANGRVLSSAEPLTTEQLVKPLGSSFSSVRDTLAHIYAAEWVWLERFQGRTPAGLPNASEFPDLKSLREKWTTLEAELLAFVRRLTQSDLDREMEFRSRYYGVLRNPLWQPMLHLVNHGSYHRGQAVTLLRQLGVSPPATDLTLFYREHAPPART